MRFENVLDGILIMMQSECIKNFMGVTLLVPEEPIGSYFEKGVYKTLTFKDMMYRIVNGISLPKTFAKFHSLSPLYVWLEEKVIIPGHMEHWFIPTRD